MFEIEHPPAPSGKYREPAIQKGRPSSRCLPANLRFYWYFACYLT